MPELSVAPDPSLWSIVPPREHADAWVLGLLGARTQTQQQHLLLAAELSLQALEASEGGLVLLLADPDAEVYSALTIVATDEAPIADAERAVELALAILPGVWEPAVTGFTLGGAPAWRVVALSSDPEAGPDAVTLLTTVTTAYVLAVQGRLVVAKLSALSPAGAIIAQQRSEQVLATLEVADV